MFPQSSQNRLWMFPNAKVMQDMRIKQNTKYIETHGAHMSPEERTEFFLTPIEEHYLLRQYEYYLNDFCRRFEPTMPKSVTGTAFHFFKRFYLKNTPMDYHPKEILLTCIYLACKVDEFNVSIGQFVNNVKGDKQKAINIILSNELLLMKELNYYLTVHNPYRPLEGFIIDINTRTDLSNPERLRPSIDEFIEKSFYTDACMLYAPSQIALAALLHSASKVSENYDSYVTNKLFESSSEKLLTFIEIVRKIRLMVKKVELPAKEKFRIIDKKLEKCRNPENNPDSEIYKECIRNMDLDEDDGILLEPDHIRESSPPHMLQDVNILYMTL